jgi:N-hydroxyarylamine O-acetyltransferase
MGQSLREKAPKPRCATGALKEDEALPVIADLDAYLRRIGFQGKTCADLPTLQTIAQLHPQAIAFENLDAWLGRTPSLDPQQVEDKLVHRRRGGWCFEQNLLLGNALRTLGFQVQDLAARVLWGRSIDDRTPRTHRLLQVDCGGRRWLVDAGFGVLTPTCALDLDSREAQSTPLERFRLQPVEGDLLLEVAPGAGADRAWLPLYRFDLQPQWPVDFEAANFQLSRDPNARFVQRLVLNRPTSEGRYGLRDLQLEFWNRGGAVDIRALRDTGELLQVLEQVFDIDTQELVGLEERISR